MAFNTKEQEIIKYGLQNGKTKEEVTQAITNYRSGVVTQPKPQTQEEPFNLAKETIKGLPKAAAQILVDPAVKFGVSALASPIDLARQTMGKDPMSGQFPLPSGDMSKTIQSDFTDKATQVAEGNMSPIGATAGTVLDTVLGGADVLGAEQLAKGGVQLVKSGANLAKETIAPSLNKITETGTKVVSDILPKSPEIMNRVARLTPKQANDFKRIAGKSQGEYLVETGNFGSPDKIITTEAEKFLTSKKDVDTALEGLKGNFQDGSVKDALSGLLERAKSTSGENIKSPYLKTVEDLIAKHDTQGLTMSEINEAKRLYERNVKLGYTKMLNPKEVELATNIDTALREWQVSKAKELGFDNIAEMNKQTQISKNLIDSLGKQLVGQEQINSMGLTDWIMLSGGDTTSVAGLLTKKLFSNKSIQSKIAKMLSSGDVKLPVKPVLNSSKLPQPQQLEKLPISSQIKVKASNTDTISNTSKRTIKETVPQKDGTIQKLINSYKALPNKQGGFVRLPFSNKIVKAIDEMTKKEIYDLDKYLGNSLKTGETNKGMEKTLDLIMEKFEISPDLSVTQIRTKLRKLMDNTKTR